MSDEQDFFFDEETEQPVKETKASSKTTKSGRSAKAAAEEPVSEPASGGLFSQDVTMGVAAMMAVVALLVGLIIGILLPSGSAVPTTGTAAPISTTPGASGQQAPPLPEGTDTNQLPPGHPNIGGGAGGSTSASETTPSK